MKNLLVRTQIILFIIVLFLVSGYWISRNRDFPEISVVEGRELEQFPRFGVKELMNTAWLIKEGLFTNARIYFWDPIAKSDFQQQVLEAASDQFPYRIPLIRFARVVDRAMISTTYLFMPDPAVPLDTTSGFYLTKDKSMVIKGIPQFSPAVTDVLDKQIENFTAMAGLFPEQNFYIYYFDRVANSELDPRIPYFEGLDGGQSFRYFASHLPDGITLQKMEFSEIDEFNRYFYHTDHHWNIRGAWRAYQEIYEMVNDHSSGLSQGIRSISFRTLPDLEFLGTYARDTLYPFEPEPFEIGAAELPPYEIIYQGKGIDYNVHEEYESGIFEKDHYISHYEKYFGKNLDLIEYRFDNDSTRNLLLFGTSHKLPLQPWIASHYHISYFVDLRLYENFSLSEFLLQHHVDDIIILTDTGEILDERFMIDP